MKHPHIYTHGKSLNLTNVVDAKAENIIFVKIPLFIATIY
jgi:hypothetical protein